MKLPIPLKTDRCGYCGQPIKPGEAVVTAAGATNHMNYKTCIGNLHNAVQRISQGTVACGARIKTLEESNAKLRAAMNASIDLVIACKLLAEEWVKEGRTDRLTDREHAVFAAIQSMYGVETSDGDQAVKG